MRYIILFITCWVLLFFPAEALAHLPGQPSFFKINGKYSGLYPVLSTSVAGLTLPQDIGPEHYLFNSPIEFEIDTERMQLPLQIIEETTFEWNFGDGSKGSGLKNSHIYKTIGSYEISITATSPDTSESQLIQSVMVHIVPNESYKVPKAVIKANNKYSRDPLSDIIELSFLEPIEFDGRESKALSSKIKSFYWDFGDEQSSNKSHVQHTFDNKYYMVFPFLRVKDENGFISDTFAQINNTTRDDTKISSKKQSPTFLMLPIIGVITVVATSILGVLVLKKSFRKRK